MFENTKCECGHQNYTGTVLCESCGKPLDDDNGTAPLEMRYDGVARRSQRANPSLLDRVWNFFSSVKVAVYLIVITLCAAMIGTIYPQQNMFINIDLDQYYAEEYGKLGQIYHFLGFSNTYDSWWFKTLLVMIGASLIICSLDRVLPLYRALKKQTLRKHPSFISRQKVVYSGALADDEPSHIDTKQWIEQFSQILKKNNYRVQYDDSALMAEKNRFSRWGPYVNHIGLIIFLLAILLRYLPGWHMDQYISIMEGETKQIPGTHLFLKNEQFTVEFYEEDELTEQFREEGRIVPKKFETKAVLYECIDHCDIPGLEPILKEVKRHDILVNHPLEYKGLMAYQIDYDVSPQIMAVDVSLKRKDTGEHLGKFKLQLHDPEDEYVVGPYTLKVLKYYRDYGYKEDGTPTSLSPNLNAPAFVFLIKGPDLPPEGDVHMYFPKPADQIRFEQDRINQATGSRFEIGAESMEDIELAIYSSFLNIRVDRAIPFIWVGAAICMIGLVMGFYWHHRRIWLRIDQGHLLLGAHTNKNWYGLRREVAKALEQIGIHVDPKSLENEVKRS